MIAPAVGGRSLIYFGNSPSPADPNLNAVLEGFKKFNYAMSAAQVMAEYADNATHILN